MNASVRIHAIDDLHGGDVEKNVHQNRAGDRCEKDSNTQPSDCLLVLDHKELLRLLRVEKEMCKHGHGGHAAGRSPRKARVPAVLAAVGDA